MPPASRSDRRVRTTRSSAPSSPAADTSSGRTRPASRIARRPPASNVDDSSDGSDSVQTKIAAARKQSILEAQRRQDALDSDDRGRQTKTSGATATASQLRSRRAGPAPKAVSQPARATRSTVTSSPASAPSLRSLGARAASRSSPRKQPSGHLSDSSVEGAAPSRPTSSAQAKSRTKAAPKSTEEADYSEPEALKAFRQQLLQQHSSSEKASPSAGKGAAKGGGRTRARAANVGDAGGDDGDRGMDVDSEDDGPVAGGESDPSSSETSEIKFAPKRSSTRSTTRHTPPSRSLRTNRSVQPKANAKGKGAARASLTSDVDDDDSEDEAYGRPVKGRGRGRLSKSVATSKLKDFIVSDSEADPDDSDDSDEAPPRRTARTSKEQAKAARPQRAARSVSARRNTRQAAVSDKGTDTEVSSEDFESTWTPNAQRKRGRQPARGRPRKETGPSESSLVAAPARKRPRRSEPDAEATPTRIVATRRRGNVDDLPLPILGLPPSHENFVIIGIEPDAAVLALEPVRVDHIFPPVAVVPVDSGSEPESEAYVEVEDGDSDNDSDDSELSGSDLEGRTRLRGRDGRLSRSTRNQEDDEEYELQDPREAEEPEEPGIPYEDPASALEKHWDTCRRCGDKPSLHYWGRALAARKRMETKNRKKTRLVSPAKKTRSERTSYTRGMFEEGVVLDTAEQRMEEWLDSLESRGGWFQCSTCTASSHWGCLNQPFQHAVLSLLNGEREARRRYLGEASSAPITGIRMNELVDSVACPDCSVARWTCHVCKGDVQGERVSEDLGGPSPEAIARLPSPPIPPAAPRLFRCTRCHRCSHYECHPPTSADDDNGDTPEELARAAQENGWLCGDCRKWPSVDQILAWRPLDKKEWTSREARNRVYPAYTHKDHLDREYLIKFKDRSFRETVWVPHDWLRISSTVALDHFLKRGTRLELEPAEVIESSASAESVKKGRASLALGGGFGSSSVSAKVDKVQKIKKVVTMDDVGQVDLGPPGPEPNAQDRIPRPWKTPDRILSVRYYSSLEKGSDQPGGEKVDVVDLQDASVLDPSNLQESWSHISQMLVKWQDIGYERCTWEDLPSRRKDYDVFAEYQKAYKSFLVARQVSIPHLSREEKQAQQDRHKKKFRPLEDQPSCVRGGDLLDFQLEGVNWLRYGWHTHQPGILADEMGLGKTVQVISFLGQLWTEYKAGPFLVVVPNSTLPNWLREFEKWLPQLRVVPYWGEADARDTIAKFELFHSESESESKARGRRSVKTHVVVASDSAVRADSLPLRKVGSWDVMIVDEGQNLKSGESVLLKKLNEMKAQHRIIMTGTPLNNNIGELFNLLNWLEPGGQWSGIKELKRKYEVLSPQLIEELQPKLKPYFLRRVKADVLDLPPKTELIVPTSLRPIQKRIYRSILEHNIEDIQALTGGRVDKKSQRKAALTNLNNILMQLRKCIQHPYLIAPDLEAKEGDKGYEAVWEHQRLVDASAKMLLLQRLLPKLKERGHRVLLFSQFVINLDLVEVFLSGEGYKYLRLDGTIGQKQRQRGIDAFNAPGSDYFIYMISTRAGGVGINLATADTVIIFDPDFNPHVDMQAIARAHRIGQTKKVLVFTMMCKGTAEERMIESAKKKMVLDHLIVQNLNNEEDRPETLESILKFGAQALFAEGGLEETEKDVRYTDEDLDALLDRGEDDDDTADANGGGQFSYARVWENDKKLESGIAQTSAALVDDDFWADLLEKHRIDAQKKAEEDEEIQRMTRRQRRDANIRAMIKADEDVTVEPFGAQKRGRGRPKGSGKKSKKQANAAGDDDFVARASADSGSDGEFDDTVPEDIRELDRKKKSVGYQPRPYQVPFRADGDPAATLAGPSSAASAAAAGGSGTVAGATADAATNNLATAEAQRSASNAERTMEDFGIIHKLDATLPVDQVTQAQKDVFMRVLHALPAPYWAEIRRRRLESSVPPTLPRPEARHQLTKTHVEYFSKAFNMPVVLFGAAFTIVPDTSIPAEIRNLPYGGAVALNATLVKELLTRMAFYMLLACSTPRQTGPNDPTLPTEPPPVASSEEAAKQILDNPARSQAWLERIKDLKLPQVLQIAEVAMQAPSYEQKVKMLVYVERAILERVTQMRQQASSAASASPAPTSAAPPRSQQPPPADANRAQPSPSTSAAVDPAPAGASPSPSVSQRPAPTKKKAAPTMADLLRLSRGHPLAAGSPGIVSVGRNELKRLDAMDKTRKPRSSLGSKASREVATPSAPSPSPGPSSLSATSSAHQIGTPRTPTSTTVAANALPAPAPGQTTSTPDDPSEPTRFIPKPVQRCSICLGPFHFINKCPTMHDVSLASMRWHELVNEASTSLATGGQELANLKTVLKVMTIKLNAMRSDAGLARMEVPNHLLS